MRTGTVSAICVLVTSICSPHPATAQSNASSPSMLQASPQMLAALAKPFELPRRAETGSVPLRIDSANEPTNPLQTWIYLLPQQNKPSAIADQFQEELTERLKKGILPQVEASRCAHIVIFQAPTMDSEMIKESPRAFTRNMPAFEGLPPCCRDFRTAMVPRTFHGLIPIPPRAPFVTPRRTPPAPNLGIWLNNLQP
jgi:hypothetical protein